MPAVVYNQSLDHEKYVKVGDTITIQLGYDDNLVTEYVGYVQRIDTDDDSLTFNCEDSMYLTRKSVKNKQFLNTSVKAIAQYCMSAIGLKNLDCTYDITYQKFVINNANAFDVLKKLKDDTKANMYMIGDTLHIHPPYVEKGGDVVYDFSVNIESSDLKYRNKDDRKFEVQVNGIGMDGKKKKVTVGTTGGEKRTVTITSPMSDADLKKRGESELQYLSYDGYEGSITGWLIPFAAPTYSAKIIDKDYEYKTGTYYVTAVTTTFSESGGVRKVEIGKKVSN
ncbi:hypothetical protein [Dysgonomonas sp. GY617]|uniref:hypothetical protein n=1 Tax=Dysgonomonas sp. GY617 TaxID=2780420 RepID=UPI001883D4C7|nr:hypothetical protein [Dysgonomonas sp. GY617]MBF0576599.1 hypothetical protein [Dysgonomonas sp. GY617]